MLMKVDGCDADQLVGKEDSLRHQHSAARASRRWIEYEVQTETNI